MAKKGAVAPSTVPRSTMRCEHPSGYRSSARTSVLVLQLAAIANTSGTALPYAISE